MKTDGINQLSMEYKYPSIHQFSKDIGIDENALIEAYVIENEFHERILNEMDPQKRKELYSEVYRKVHQIYEKGRKKKIETNNTKDKIVMLFKEELEGKSILDIGCGKGDFLSSIAKNIKHKELLGIDVDISYTTNHKEIQFVCADIVNFELNKKFDVVFSDNVFEHIAPADIDTHINSIVKVLNPDGKLILIMPNRLFGPSDVTRIIDCSYTNKICARGTHLFESTYSDMMPLLKRFGFKRFKVVFPIPCFHWKFRICINPYWLRLIENNILLLKTLHLMKINSKCIVKIPVILICSL